MVVEQSNYPFCAIYFPSYTDPKTYCHLIPSFFSHLQTRIWDTSRHFPFFLQDTSQHLPAKVQ
jgi:hypothetical protein